MSRVSVSIRRVKAVPWKLQKAYNDIVQCEHLRVAEKVALVEELLDAAMSRALTPSQRAAIKRLGEHHWRKGKALMALVVGIGYCGHQ